jgi:V-type H+-transporting ATPase proteolipid subunit
MAPFSGDETAPFFGFLGAAAALVFSCKYSSSSSSSSTTIDEKISQMI